MGRDRSARRLEAYIVTGDSSGGCFSSRQLAAGTCLSQGLQQSADIDIS
jgi:hypothetical protein